MVPVAQGSDALSDRDHRASRTASGEQFTPPQINAPPHQRINALTIQRFNDSTQILPLQIFQSKIPNPKFSIPNPQSPIHPHSSGIQKHPAGWDGVLLWVEPESLRAQALSFSPVSSPASTAAAPCSGRRSGKRMTSRMDSCPVKIIVRRSTPIPRPAAGGIPYSIARR